MTLDARFTQMQQSTAGNRQAAVAQRCRMTRHTILGGSGGDGKGMLAARWKSCVHGCPPSQFLTDEMHARARAVTLM